MGIWYSSLQTIYFREILNMVTSIQRFGSQKKTHFRPKKSRQKMMRYSDFMPLTTALSVIFVIIMAKLVIFI